MAIKRSAMKAQLSQRLEEQQKHKNKGMTDYESYFEAPEGVGIFNTKPTDGDGTDYGYDIIPFVAGNNFPTNGYNIKSGDLAYVLDVWVHRNIGAANKSMVCPLKSYGLPCPACEKRVEVLAEQGQMDKDEYRKFSKTIEELIPKRRVIYNVICRSDSKQEAKGIQIYENSHFYVEKKLQDAAKRPRGGGLVPYPDPDEGKTIWQNWKLKGEKEWEVAAPIFEDRQYIITDEEIESATQLDQIISLLDYDEILEIMGNSKSKPVEEEKEEPVVNRRGLKQEAVEPYPSGPITEEDIPLTFKDDPKPVSETGAEVQVCPYGGEFAKEFDDYQECDNCAIRSDCKFAKEEAEKVVKAPAKRRKVLSQ